MIEFEWLDDWQARVSVRLTLWEGSGKRIKHTIKYVISKREGALYQSKCSYCYTSETIAEQWRVDKLQILKFMGIPVNKKFLSGNYVCSRVCAKLLIGKLKRIG